MDDPGKTGKETSEWAIVVRGIAAIVATSLGAILSSGLVPNESLGYTIIGLVGMITAAIGGVTWKYIDSRTTVKAVQLANKAKAADPT